MEEEQKQPIEDLINDLLEHDDDFDQFDVNKELTFKNGEKESRQQWDDIWDDGEANDDFSLQLKVELENNFKKI
ncbi:hypothetical protein Nepgr_012530 [Nepenthes gracilis]|uniref:26S proteasome complex subunit SEM1 n=1 Tax=Nepenthes gracilis TaxID=150966 RepID=A0AAD3SHD5_NEPGR|nr:hypothetical protein Nepgr_012530 [Nepenthes gracilis]